MRKWKIFLWNVLLSEHINFTYTYKRELRLLLVNGKSSWNHPNSSLLSLTVVHSLRSLWDRKGFLVLILLLPANTIISCMVCLKTTHKCFWVLMHTRVSLKVKWYLNINKGLTRLLTWKLRYSQCKPYVLFAYYGYSKLFQWLFRAS